MFRINLKAVSLRILWYINLFFALLLLLCYLAPIVSPSVSSWLAILALGFPFFLLVNILWIGFWLYHRSRAIYLSFLTILIGCTNVPYVIGFGGSVQAPPSALRLMSYNVHYFNSGPAKDATVLEQKQDEILRYIADQRPDLLFGQEFSGKGVFSSKRAQQVLAREAGLIYSHQGGQSSLAIYSKYPLDKRGILHFENSANGAIFADVQLPGQRVRLYAFHLQSTRLGQDANEVLKKENITSLNKKETQDKYYRIESKLTTAFELRVAQAQTLARHMAESPYPVILAGDLNDTPMSYAYNKLSDKLKDSFVERGAGLGATYAGGLPALRIDYILCSQDFIIYNHQTQRRAISDHRAVISEVKLKNK